MGELGKGVIEITLTQNFGNIPDHEYDLLDFLLDESGRPVTWLAIFDRDDQPEASQRTLTRADPLIKRGGVPQMTCRPFVSEFSMRRSDCLCDFPGVEARLQSASRSTQPDFCRTRVPRVAGRGNQARRRDWEKVTVTEVGKPELKACENRTWRSIARERGKADASST